MKLFKLMTLIAVAVAVPYLSAMPEQAHAADTCKAKIDPKTGAIQFSARNVLGILRWGNSFASAINSFANTATCVNNGKATKCELGAPGTGDQITPPELCRLFVKDIGGANCSAFLKGCTPGVRPGSTAASARGSAKAGVIANCTAVAGDVEIRRSFNNVNASAITIDDGVLPGRCEITFPFSLEDKFYSVEVVSGVTLSTTFKLDYEVSGSTISILTQEYVIPAWVGLGLQVSVLIF